MRAWKPCSSGCTRVSGTARDPRVRAHDDAGAGVDRRGAHSRARRPADTDRLAARQRARGGSTSASKSRRTAGRSQKRVAGLPSSCEAARPALHGPARSARGRVLVHRQLAAPPDLTPSAPLQHVPVGAVRRRHVLVSHLVGHVLLVGAGGEERGDVAVSPTRCCRQFDQRLSDPKPGRHPGPRCCTSAGRRGLGGPGHGRDALQRLADSYDA